LRPWIRQQRLVSDCRAASAPPDAGTRLADADTRHDVDTGPLLTQTRDSCLASASGGLADTSLADTRVTRLMSESRVCVTRLPPPSHCAMRRPPSHCATRRLRDYQTIPLPVGVILPFILVAFAVWMRGQARIAGQPSDSRRSRWRSVRPGGPAADRQGLSLRRTRVDANPASGRSAAPRLPEEEPLLSLRRRGSDSLSAALRGQHQADQPPSRGAVRRDGVALVGGE
jgi:hypothetical protein